MNFWDQFHDLRVLAMETMQTATVWSVDRDARAHMLKNMFPPQRSTDQIERFCGIEIKVDPSLPRGRVVLKAGENTVGAFNIHSEETSE